MAQSKFDPLSVQSRPRDVECMYVCGSASRNAIAPVVESKASADTVVEVASLTDIERVVIPVCLGLADDVNT